MKSTKQSSDYVKLDEILKILFTVSDKVLITLLNALFNENFDPKQTTITPLDKEFPDEVWGILKADLVFILEQGGKKRWFQIEFQTENDTAMVIRMFKYGFVIAQRYSESDVLYFPEQLVIFFEKNSAIKDHLTKTVVLPDGQRFNYTVNVLKYWEYSREDLLQNEMYPLLPIQIFNYRLELRNARQKQDFSRIQALAKEMLKTTKILIKESKHLVEAGKVSDYDFAKMMEALRNLTNYLNRNFIEDNKIEKEVMDMMLIDILEQGKQEGRQEGKQEGLKQGEKKGKQLQKAVFHMLKSKESPESIQSQLGITAEEFVEYQVDFDELFNS